MSKKSRFGDEVSEAIEDEGAEVYERGTLGSGKQFICFRVGVRTGRIGISSSPSLGPRALKNAVAAARRHVRALCSA